MFFMIFVNDLWTLKKIPEWLDHVKPDVDGLGFADTIFPAFLFIVGLSLPLALKNRAQKGDSLGSLFGHVFYRGFSLVLIGFFQVNMEEFNKSTAIPRPYFMILLTLSFFLIWMDYPRDWTPLKKRVRQGIGGLILIILGFLFRGGDSHHLIGLRPYWWGILGLIGWSYLICASIYLLSKGRIWVLILTFIFFLIFSVLDHLDLLDFLDPIHKYLWITGGGAEPALVMSGVILSQVYSYFLKKEKPAYMIGVLLASVIGITLAGFAIRPVGGISKIYDTPSWVCLSLAFSLLTYAFIVYWVDMKGHKSNFKWILPAGTSTLTCYLLPYIYYSLYDIAYHNPWKFNIRLPHLMREGVPGLIKSMLFSLLIITIAGYLEKRKLRLKI